MKRRLSEEIREAKIRRSKPSSPNSIRVVFQIFFYNVLDCFCSMIYIQMGVLGFGILKEGDGVGLVQMVYLSLSLNGV